MNVIVKLVIAPGDSQGVLGHTHGGGGWGGGDLRPLSAPGMARAGRRARGGDDGARCAGFAGGLCAGCCSQGPALARAIAGHGAADDAKWKGKEGGDEEEERRRGARALPHRAALLARARAMPWVARAALRASPVAPGALRAAHPPARWPGRRAWRGGRRQREEEERRRGASASVPRENR